MKISELATPFPASGRRSVELIALTFKSSHLELQLAHEDSDRKWRARFATVQAFKHVTWECAAHRLAGFPEGCFFEVAESPWIKELGGDVQHFLSKSRHYVLSCHDEILEVVAWSHELVAIE